MNRQQRRKLNRQNEKNKKNYGFTNAECNAIDNCIRKIKHGLPCVGSVKPLITPAPISNTIILLHSELVWHLILYTQLTAEPLIFLKG